ncbi:MAG: sulfatase-like hydrolase/transferase [Planctomycetota bacterium JB042]
MSEAATGARGVLVLLGLASVLGCSRSPEGAEEVRPNLVVVTLDTTRADRLGFRGHAAAETPHLDALAARGTVFTDARTCVPLTLPAHASLWTGLYPPAHGIRDNGVASLGAAAETVAERAKEAGYATGAFVSAFVLDAQYGLDQGFDVYDGVPTRRLISGGFIEERPANETVDAALAWIETVERPYLLWVHLFDPHAPYAPPGGDPDATAEEAYDGEIAFCDAELGRLFAALGGATDEPAPIVCVTADHGEAFGEHGEATHGVFVYDATLRVPLVFAGPGVPAGARDATPASIVDVAPTLLALAGLPPATDAHGAALLGGDGGAPRRPIWFESLNGWIDHRWSPLVGVTNGVDKVIEAPRPELFDVRADPGERDDRAGRDEASLARLRDAARSAWSALARERPLAEAREIGEEERRTLEQLGYTVGAGGAGGDAPYPGPDLPDPKDRIGVETAKNRALALMARFRADPARNGAALDRAIALLERALVDDPRAPLLHESLGACLVQRREFERGVEHLRECLALRPERVEARHALAVAFLALGREDDARRELRRCLDDQPSFVLAARTLAMHLEDAKEWAAAADAWRHFLREWDGDDEHRRAAREGLVRALANE